MSRHARAFGRFLPLITALAALPWAGCAEEAPSSSGYALPLRLNPLRVQGASEADSVAAWALFDRDTGTRWTPEGGADLDITLDAPRTLAYVKVFGPASGSLELVRAGGGTLLQPVNLATLRSGWNRIAMPPSDAVDRLTLRVTGASSVPDLELWAMEAPRTLLDTDRLLEQVAWGKLDGQADVVAAQPAKVTLATMGNESCGDFLFELPRDPSVYRRAWITYGATGLYRPFAVTRGLNDGPRTTGPWFRDDLAVGVFVEPLDPARLEAGLNWYQVCLPSGATGTTTLQDARFVGELDHGTNHIEVVAIGSAGLTPTDPAGFLLDPGNSQTQEVTPEQRIVVAFERWIAPDAILLATDRHEWQVDCLDTAGAGVRLSTERTFDDTRGVGLLVEPSGSETLCAGLALQPAKATARVSFLSVAGSGARDRVDWTRIELASAREHFGRVAWVEGWAAVPEGLTAETRIDLDGRDTGTTIGVFGEMLRRQGNRSDAWPVTVTARLSDGTSVSRQFVLGRYADPSGAVESALGGQGTQLTPEESAERYGEVGETVEQPVDPDSATSIRLGTQVGVDIPAGAVNGNGVVVSITHLDAASVPPLDPGLINVTAPTDHGYEFLPHGQEFREALTVLLPFDTALVPPGYTNDDVHAYYFDDGAQRWRRLMRSQVDADGTTRSLTDHFTTMINAVVVAPEHPGVTAFNPTEISGIRAADPSAKVSFIEPPTSNPQGAANLRYPLDFPVGRAGLQPKLDISYSSNKGNGWVGMGWDLPFPAISIDTRFGAPRFDPTTETETYTLEGAQLTPIAHRGPPRARTDGTTTVNGETVKIFHKRVEGEFLRIIRHGSHPSNYWWEVIDKTGTRFFYGGSPDTSGPASDSTLVAASGAVFLWGLREVRDAHGNSARYCAERVQDFGLAEGTVPGWELYLSSIDYTRDPGTGRTCEDDDLGPYRVKFLRDSQVGAPRRPDVIIDGKGRFKRVTAERLRRVEVYFRTQLVRAWDLEYDIGAFHKSRVTSIRQFGVGNSPFPGNVHTFEYFDDVRDDPTGAPGNYGGFAGAAAWDSPDDDIDSGLFLPSAVLGAFGPDEPSALGGGTSHTAGGHIYIGFNPLIASKTGSFGGKIGFGGGESTGVAALLDVNGDGLADKVFRTGSGFQFRPNEAGPDGGGGLRFDDDPFSLGGLSDAISRDTTFFFSFGVEVYPLIFGIIFNHSESFTRTSTYTSDVNGDGLPDLVAGGNVLFNRRAALNMHEFVGTSTGTPFPIVPGSVDTSGLLPDFGDVQDAAEEANPLVDTVRFWVAPISGTVSITAPVQLAQPSIDGVRVAIQKNGSELWHADIAGDDLAVKTPTGVSSVSVFPGDRIYFRVNSVNNGKNDEVTWSPSIAYTGSSVLDENGLNVRQYSAMNDFILGGRPGINTHPPFEGTVRLQGTFKKTRVTSDDVDVSIRRNGTTVFFTSLDWDEVADVAIDHSFTVNPNDSVELFVGVDSPIDLTSVSFDPAVLMTYTSAVDGDGNPVTVNNTDGSPIFKVYVPYDMDIYGVRIPAGLPSPWVAPGDPGESYTLPIKVTVDLPFFATGALTYTTKQQNERFNKHTFFPNFGVPQTFTFNLPVDATESYFFDFTSLDRDVAFGSFTSVVIDLGFIEIPLPRAVYTVTVPDLCSRPYRGWSVAGYVPDPDAMDDPIRHSGAEPFCSTDSGFDEDTDLPEERGDLEDNVGSLNSMVTRAFAPFPGGRNCTIPSGTCQIPSGVLWGGADDLSVPTAGDIAGVGASAVSRLSHTSENALSVSVLSLSGSRADAETTGEVDYLDMNGDKFPDIVSHSGVQFTDPRGTLAERFAIVDNVRESESVAYNAGIGGNVATSIGNGKGRFGPTGSSPGTTAENGSQMAELGFNVSLSGNVSTNDVNSELMDINGDGLPDRLTIDGGELWVQFNLGYEFAHDAEKWDGDSAINTGNGAQIGGGAGASLGFNDGNYGFGGGFNVATSWGRINEWVDALQDDGKTLADVNGDGLIDRVVADGGHFDVRFNTGNGFAGGETWTGSQDRDVTENRSTTAGAGAYFTISIGPLCIAACYLIINPGFDLGETLQRPEAALQDINGDSYPDHLVSEDDGELTVSLNNHARTNLIKRVNRPMHASFEVDYERKGNTFEDPSNHWVLSYVKLSDGHAGDGADDQLTTLSYGPGNYDRFEREFYGFSEVVETVHDTRAGLPGPAYREIRREFHNQSFFLHDQLRRETLTGFDTGADLVYRVTENDYLLRDVDSGGETTDPNVVRFTLSSVFPQLQRTTKRMSEGDALIALETQQVMTYDEFGNVSTLTDTGDAGGGDDYTAVITYTGASGGAHTTCADKYIVGRADSIVVRDSLGAVLRQRTGGYNCATGDMTHLERTIDDTGAVAAGDYVYAANGNLTRVTEPENQTGQRYFVDYLYDDDIQTHIKQATDVFGTRSDLTYDLRFGEQASVTDSNGNTISRSYDDFGRLATVTGPYEQGTGYATITFEYHQDAPVPYARTKHHDPFRSLTDPIETILFTDGIKRVLQIKKDFTQHQGPSTAAIDKMGVSGRLTFDHMGRTVENYYPTVEAKNDTINTAFSPAYDTVAPTETSHDVLNRTTLQTFPDGTATSHAFELAADRHGALRLAATTTDAMSNRKIVYSDVREQTRSIQEFNTTKGEEIWTEYEYDPINQLLEITDDHGNRTTTEYDLLGRRTVLDSPDAGRIVRTFDGADNLVEKVTGHVGAAGGVVTYEYDHRRLIAIHYPLFPENDVAYVFGGAELRGHGGNRVARITRVTDESGVEERQYGKLGELTQETKTLASDTLGACSGCPEVWSTQYVYDTWQRLQEMTYPDTEVLTYNYDSGGQVRKLTGHKLGIEYEYVTRLEYDKFEKRAFMEYGNEIRTTYSYDPVDRTLSRLEAGNFQDLNYEYDDIGNVTHLLNDVPPANPNEMGGRVEQTFEYDSLYRLTHADGTFRYGPQKTDAYDLDLDYDTIHNILSKDQEHTVQTKNNKPIEQHKTTYDVTYSYDGAQPHAPSRIAGTASPGFEDRAFSYDASGNQLGWDDLTSGRRRNIVWDEENRVQSISDNGKTTTFKYNAEGQRVIKRGAQGETAYINQFWTIRNRTVGTKHVFVGANRMASKLSPGTAHSNPGDLWGDMLKNWYDHHSGVFPGRAVGHFKKHVPDDNFIYYYHPDHLGSTSYVTDPDGELYEHMQYFPFGESWVEENSNTERMPYLFSSKELDQETGLYYFGARYYDPMTSVWQSTDPHLIDEPGAAVSGPFVLSAYTYTALNPIRLIDPDGRQADEPESGGAVNMCRSASDYVSVVSAREGHMRLTQYPAEMSRVKGDIANWVSAEGETEGVARRSVDARNQSRASLRAKGNPVIDNYLKATRGQWDYPSYELLREGDATHAPKTDSQIINSSTKTNAGWNRAAKIARVGGVVMTVADVGIAGYNVYNAPEGEKGAVAMKETGRVGGALAGGWAGAKGGAAAGALIGSIFPGPGTAIGGVVGGVIGGIGGAMFGGWLGEKGGEAAANKVLPSGR